MPPRMLTPCHAPLVVQARAAMHLREYVNDDDIDCAIR